MADADAILIVTNHKDYYKMDLERLKGQMRNPIIIDGRNVFNAHECRSQGFIYLGIGKA